MIGLIMRIFTWRQRAIVFVTTSLSIGTFLLLGYGFDEIVGTRPIGFVIGLVVSYPVTQMLVVRRMKKQIDKEQAAE
jgi:F0F1-type ATP synthase assembly protein I